MLQANDPILGMFAAGDSVCAGFMLLHLFHAVHLQRVPLAAKFSAGSERKLPRMQQPPHQRLR